MLSTTKILIVEDEDILAENLKSYLSRRSPNVRVAADAITAIEVLKDFTQTLCCLIMACQAWMACKLTPKYLHLPRLKFLLWTTLVCSLS